MLSPLKDKKLFLLDMDGTIYLSETLFPRVHEFLARIRENGGRYLFLTNNSSKGVESYLAKMARLGIEAVREDFLTSVDALIDYLLPLYPDTLLYVFGTESFKAQLRSAGLKITDRLEEGIGALVMGFDTELTFQKLEDACILLNKGIPYIATNPDLVCPTWYGSVPDCGSVANILETATGRRPLVIGKPKPRMVELALKRTGFSREQALMVGDRVYTDIACGVNAGIDTVLVLSGEGTVADAQASDTPPTWILPDVARLEQILTEGLEEAPWHK
jgi:HAD superfamily hydrolase (TIGR01457 family)